MSESPATGGAVTLSVAGMTCPTCEETLQRVLSRLPGIRSVAADHTTGEVRTNRDSGGVAGRTRFSPAAEEHR